MNSPLFYPTFNENPVTVTFVDGTATKVTVAWPAVAGAVSYNVYGSPSPYTRNKLTDTPILVNSFEYVVPPVSRDVYWNFWITWVNGSGQETWITNDAAALYSRIVPFNGVTSPQSTAFGQNMVCEPAMTFYSEEIRRRHKVQLENDGEEFEVYLRRWGETACPYEDERRSPDPDYNSLTKCAYCFGTGVLGGYYPKIVIKVRYGGVPTRKIVFGKEGISLGHDFNSWTLWSPLLRGEDVLVQRSTGERFVVDAAAKASWRGKITKQDMRLLSLQPGDIRYTITDTAISTALSSGAAVPFEKPKIWG